MRNAAELLREPLGIISSQPDSSFDRPEIPLHTAGAGHRGKSRGYCSCAPSTSTLNLSQIVRHSSLHHFPTIPSPLDNPLSLTQIPEEAQITFSTASLFYSLDIFALDRLNKKGVEILLAFNDQKLSNSWCSDDIAQATFLTAGYELGT